MATLASIIEFDEFRTRTRGERAAMPRHSTDGPASCIARIAGDVELLADKSERRAAFAVQLVGMEWAKGEAGPDWSAVLPQLAERALGDARYMIMDIAALSAPESNRSSAHRMNAAYEAALALRESLAEFDVQLALRDRAVRFFGSPTEAVDWLDEVNSPHVGWLVDCETPGATARQVEWIETLAGRLSAVIIDAGCFATEQCPTDAQWAALDHAMFDGLVAVRGAVDASVWARINALPAFARARSTGRPQ